MEEGGEEGLDPDIEAGEGIIIIRWRRQHYTNF